MIVLLIIVLYNFYFHCYWLSPVFVASLVCHAVSGLTLSVVVFFKMIYVSPQVAFYSEHHYDFIGAAARLSPKMSWRGKNFLTKCFTNACRNLNEFYLTKKKSSSSSSEKVWWCLISKQLWSTTTSGSVGIQCTEYKEQVYENSVGAPIFYTVPSYPTLRLILPHWFRQNETFVTCFISFFFNFSNSGN